ncbi:MAG: ABC transporter ATP-binding protein, partial [Dehalococcoidales bacterium]|nr:ABC transporter ATP-binding protein [Dehalococcoidales bacterium]
LTKKFKDLVAVDNVDLEIEEGECFGLLGPNGAGKTTLIRMIIAVSPPTKGDIRILGQPLAHNDRQIKAVMGVVPQHDNLDSDLTALQNLRTFARYFDIPGKEALRRSQELLKLFELESKGKSRIRELSGGMKRRLLIARGLINNPRILILDEPTIGLDPQAKYLVWHKLTELKSQGITQLLCTQNMDEAANLCDRVAIMNQGKILNINTPQRLVAEYAGKEVWEIEADSTAKHQIIEQLRSHRLDFEDTGYRIYVFHAETNGDIRELVNIMDKLKQRPATLEDVFFRLTGRSLAE